MVKNDDVIRLFLNRRANKSVNLRTDGDNLFLFENKIAMYENNILKVSDGGFRSKTTQKILNKLPSVKVIQKNFIWYLNNKEWDGNFEIINTETENY